MLCQILSYSSVADESANLKTAIDLYPQAGWLQATVLSFKGVKIMSETMSLASDYIFKLCQGKQLSECAF